jgi:hypothetical protein
MICSLKDGIAGLESIHIEVMMQYIYSSCCDHDRSSIHLEVVREKAG